MFSKKIICLANSKKLNGRCIAGKEIISNRWIRPVSNSEKGELSLEQINYPDGSCPEILDIIEIWFEREVPKNYQPENIQIAGKKWKKIGKIDFIDLEKITDNASDIWLRDSKQDRIHSSYFINNKMEESLLLIGPSNFQIEVKERSYAHKRIGAVFKFKEYTYNLGITDLKILEIYSNYAPGIYNIDYKNLFLCISLGEEYHFYHYKLVASVIFR